MTIEKEVPPLRPIPPIHGHAVHRFTMPLIHSNMYVVLHGSDALIVDPCVSEDAAALLRQHGVTGCTVLLTHEHYDHISGVNFLRERFPCRVICTEVCARQMANPRRSHAAVFPAMFLKDGPAVLEQAKALCDTRYACTADETYSGSMTLQWQDIPLRLTELPGHSPGSQIIDAAGTHVFTGDNLIPGTATLIRLPGGDPAVFRQQVVPALGALPPETALLPGHGDWGYRREPALEIPLQI